MTNSIMPSLLILGSQTRITKLELQYTVQSIKVPLDLYT